MSVIALVSFKLNDPDLLEGWTKLSAEINKNLTNVDGFISRDSAIDSDGNVYCIVKWKSEEQQATFRKIMESKDFQEKMKNFGKYVDVSTMKSKNLQVL